MSPSVRRKSSVCSSLSAILSDCLGFLLKIDIIISFLEELDVLD